RSGRSSRCVLARGSDTGAGWDWRASFAFADEVLDAVHDRVAVPNFTGDDALVRREVFSEVLDELSGAVGALHLAVREHVHARQDLALHDVHAGEGVLHRPVVAVREMERIDVPLFARVVLVDELGTEPVGARDHGATRLAGAEEGLPIHLAGHGVVDHVPALEAAVLAAEPGVDPEALDADDLLLFVSHRARDVHHVDDDGVGDRLEVFLPRAVAPIFVLRHHEGHRRVVHAARDRALERLAVGALEVAQRLGPDPADAGVAILGGDDAALALVLDGGELELLPENVGELVERHVHLEQVLARILAGLSRPVFALARFTAHRVAGVAVPLSHAALLAIAEHEAGHVDVRHRDADEILAFAPQQFPLGNVASQVLPDLAAHDVSEARVVLVDLQRHP